VKPRFRSQWVVGLLLGASCTFALSSCSGEGFTADNGAAGDGSQPSAGASNGAGDNGKAGEATTTSDSGSAGATGDAGASDESGGSADSGGGLGGSSSGGANVSGAPNAMGGAGGAAQGGSVGGAGAPAAGVKAFDDFVASAEGWTITGDDTTKTVKYSSTGGNPNGSISAIDVTTGVLFFTAPKKYLGDASAFYGGELRFDLKTAATTGAFFAYADVELTSNLTTLAYDCTPNPTTSWHSYVVPLSEAGWKLTTVTGAAVTATQFHTVLANLTRVRVRGEFTDVSDTGYLDNVYLGSKAASFPGQ
jgi:hypothetical protein